MLANILFIVSGALWAIEMIPQIRRIHKRKSVEDISIYFPILCVASIMLYLIASYLTQNWILIISITSPFICNSIFLGQCLYYRRKDV